MYEKTAQKLRGFFIMWFMNLIVTLNAVLLIEAIDTSSGLSSLLGTCVELMAFGADFYVNFFSGRTCYKLVTTVADNLCLIIIRMDSFSHFNLPF